MYLRNIATIHARIREEDAIKVSGMYFGVFYLSNIAMLVGTGIASFINTIMDELLDDVSDINDLSGSNYTKPLNISCGIHFDPKYKMEESTRQLKTINLWVILSIFIFLQLGSAVLLLFINDSESMSRELDQPDSESNTLYNNDLANITCDDEDASDQAHGDNMCPGLLRSAFSMFALMGRDSVAICIVPFSIHVGFMQSVVRGDFTRSWISCILGKLLTYLVHSVTLVKI